MDLECKKCKLPLGEMEKGKIRNGSVMLCRNCWDKAEVAIDMAELVASQGRNMFDGGASFGENPTVDHLMGIFGMKGKKE